ncbi:MAG: hypothetical protein JST66_13635 [Bacteroidetes bacterium]|nr:hypothetical protein [Bacteroidota bacterium]
MIRDTLLPLLTERFPGRYTLAGPGVEPFVTFPAEHPEVGDVQLHDDGDEITLIAGRFTHGHFSNYDGISLVEKEQAIAKDVIDFLSDLFADRVVLWGSHQGGGGWRVIDPATYEGSKRRNEYVWSGPWER